MTEQETRMPRSWLTAAPRWAKLLLRFKKVRSVPMEFPGPPEDLFGFNRIMTYKILWGRVYVLAVVRMPPSHPNCRCVTIPITEGDGALLDNEPNREIEPPEFDSVSEGVSRVPSVYTKRPNGKSKVNYVPADLDECFIRLEKMLSTSRIKSMKNATEEGMVRYHHGFGRQLRNEWGLWGDSRLARWFKDLGVWHADDMSTIILDSFWRFLNGKSIQLDEQVTKYKKFWRDRKEAGT